MKIDKKIVLILIAVFLLGGLVFYYVVDKDAAQPSDSDPIGNDQSDANKEPLQAEVITAEHSYSDGQHTVSGEVDLPTPCHELLVEAEVRESYPEQVSLVFYQLNSTSPDLACAQVITPRSFNISFAASPEAQITAQTGNRSLDLRLTDLD